MKAYSQEQNQGICQIVCLQGVLKLLLVGQLSRYLPLLFVFLAEL